MKLLISSSIASAALLVGPVVHAQTLQWEQQLPTTAPATSIAVAPNDVPFISTADGATYYLGQESVSCGTPFCFPQLAWINIPGIQAAQVSVNLDGGAFAVDVQGQTYFAITNQTANDTTLEISGWDSFRDTPDTCVNQLVPGISTGFTEANDTPPAIQFTPVVWGLGCGTLDNLGDHPPMSWDVELTQYATPWWSFNPGWEPIAPGSSAVQMVLFTEGGPSNVQVPWIRTGQGQLYSYNGYEFVKMPNPRILTNRRPAPTPSWITDHYAVEAGAIYAWNDTSQTWQFYTSAMTPQETEILQIASSQPISTNGYGVVGPSRMWGIDQNGAIWVLGKLGVAN